jgi:hypothetical protein
VCFRVQPDVFTESGLSRLDELSARVWENNKWRPFMFGQRPANAPSRDVCYLSDLYDEIVGYIRQDLDRDEWSSLTGQWDYRKLRVFTVCNAHKDAEPYCLQGELDGLGGPIGHTRFYIAAHNERDAWLRFIRHEIELKRMTYENADRAAHDGPSFPIEAMSPDDFVHENTGQSYGPSDSCTAREWLARNPVGTVHAFMFLSHQEKGPKL